MPKWPLVFIAFFGLLFIAPGCQHNPAAGGTAPDSAALALNTALAEATAAPCANRITILGPDGQAPNYETVVCIRVTATQKSLPPWGCLVAAHVLE